MIKEDQFTTNQDLTLEHDQALTLLFVSMKGKKMSHHQVEWIKKSQEPQKKFRAMIVEWQIATYAINSFIKEFNNQFFDEKSKAKDPDFGMKEIAIKKFIIASLHELKKCLDIWYKTLAKDGKLSSSWEEAKANIRAELKRIEKFKDIRTKTYHCGGLGQDPDGLIQIYEDLDKLPLDELNNTLKATIRLGYKLRDAIKKYAN